jgi:signal transduction histidine kinase
LDERQLRQLIDVGRSLVSELDLEAVLQRMLELARELTGARYAALGVLNAERTELERFLTLGIDDATRTAIGELPRGQGVLGLLISEPSPLRLRDVAEHPRSYGFPPGHPPMHSFLGLPILIRGQAFGNLYLTEKQGGLEFTEADEQAGIVLAEWAAIAIENARLYESVDSQREALEHAVHRLEAMAEITLAIDGETDLDRILAIVVERGRALVSAGWMAILLCSDDELEVTAIAGELDASVQGMRIPVESTLPGSVLRSMEPQRFTGSGKHRAPSGDARLAAEAELGVPMAFHGSDIGVLLAGDPLGGSGEFSVADQELLAAFAASASMAVTTARSVAEDRLRHSIAAAERERGRWARELHDETLQGLGALRVVLASGLQRGSPEALRTAVDEAISQLASEIQNLRSLITELRPAALDELGVAVAVRGLAERAAATQGLTMETELVIGTEDGRQDPELESTVYRLVQEGLSNIAKHSRAEHVRLRVVERNGAIEVTIEDDGVGFEPGAQHGGFGLAGMRERVAMVGGSLEVDAAPGGGARLHAVIPR